MPVMIFTYIYNVHTYPLVYLLFPKECYNRRKYSFSIGCKELFV